MVRFQKRFFFQKQKIVFRKKNKNLNEKLSLFKTINIPRVCMHHAVQALAKNYAVYARTRNRPDKEYKKVILKKTMAKCTKCNAKLCSFLDLWESYTLAELSVFIYTVELGKPWTVDLKLDFLHKVKYLILALDK